MARIKEAVGVWVRNCAHDAVADYEQNKRVEHYVVHDSRIGDLCLREPSEVWPKVVQKWEDSTVGQ